MVRQATVLHTITQLKQIRWLTQSRPKNISIPTVRVPPFTNLKHSTQLPHQSQVGENTALELKDKISSSFVSYSPFSKSIRHNCSAFNWWQMLLELCTKSVFLQPKKHLCHTFYFLQEQSKWEVKIHAGWCENMLTRLWVDGSQDKVSIIKRTIDFGTKVQGTMFRCQLIETAVRLWKSALIILEIIIRGIFWPESELPALLHTKTIQLFHFAVLKVEIRRIRAC